MPGGGCVVPWGAMTDTALDRERPRSHSGVVTQPALEPSEDDEAWRDLQDVLEERDAEWWAEEQDVDEPEG